MGICCSTLVWTPVSAVMFAASLLMLSGCASGRAAGSSDVANSGPVRIVLVGDSTVASKTGWGDALCELAGPAVDCINKAKGGRSSKSYRAEGSWSEVMELLAKGGAWTKTYVFVQFGHNDQPGKGARTSDLATEFIPNLNGYVADIRRSGAEPVLLTPLTRRQFNKGILQDSLSPWAAATRRAAEANGVALLDLASDSVLAVQTLGPVEAMEFAQAPPPESVVEIASRTGTTTSAPKPEPDEPPRAYFDYTHLGPAGAEFFARIVAAEIRTAIPGLHAAFGGS